MMDPQAVTTSLVTSGWAPRDAAPVGQTRGPSPGLGQQGSTPKAVELSSLASQESVRFLWIDG